MGNFTLGPRNPRMGNHQGNKSGTARATDAGERLRNKQGELQIS